MRTTRAWPRSPRRARTSTNCGSVRSQSMTGLSPRVGLTIPNADGSDPANLAALLRSLGLDVENKAPGVTAMTDAARVALTGDAKFSGRVVWCTDTATLHVCDGTNWWPIVRLTSDGRLAAGVSELDAGMFSATAPVMDGSAAVGSSLKPARSDHRHPADTSRLPLAGGTMSGNLNMGGNEITNLSGSANASSAATVGQVNSRLPLAGGTMTGPIAMGGNKVTGLAAGTASTDAARFGQVPKGNRALVTLDSSGNGQITHGWGSAPTWAQLTVESPYSVFPHLVSITPTVLNVRASSPSAIIVSDVVWMHWTVGT